MLYLVVEVADLQQEILYQCRSKKALSMDLKIGFDNKGKILKPQLVRLEAVNEYPWSESLRITNPHFVVKSGGPRRIIRLKQDEWLKNAGERFCLKMIQDKEAKKWKPTFIQTDQVQKLKTRAEQAVLWESWQEWKQQHDKLRGSLKEQQGILNNKKAKEEAKVKARKELGKIQKQITEHNKQKPKRPCPKTQPDKQKLLHDLKAFKEAYEGIGPIPIVDAWGAPVVELKPKFDIPGGKVNNKAIAALGRIK